MGENFVDCTDGRQEDFDKGKVAAPYEWFTVKADSSSSRILSDTEA